MIFNFAVLIILAVVSTIGSTNFSLNSYVRSQLLNNCSRLVAEYIKHLDSCEVPESRFEIRYHRDAFPYVCLMSLDVAVELCKEPELVEKFHRSSLPDSVCPMDHAPEPSNLNISIKTGITYMSNKMNCNGVCDYDEYLNKTCQFIALANKIIKEGKGVGESLDRVKGADNQSVHLLVKEKKDSLTVGGGIEQDAKLAQETKPKVSPKQLHEYVQSVTNNNSDIYEPITKPQGISENKTTNTADPGLKSNLESKRLDVLIHKNESYKSLNDSNSSKVSVNKTVLKDDISKNKDNDKIKSTEVNKQQDLAVNKWDTDVPGTESPPPPPLPQQPLENDYSSKNQLNNVNVNSNINNMEFEDDPALKTSHDEGEDDDDNNNEDMDKSPMQDTHLEEEPQFAKSVNQKEIYSGDNFFQAEDSHFSAYFLTTVSLIIVGYLIYHNKKKILAYALEGRRNKNGRRRPTSASYRKLDCNLEEAIASNPSNTSVTNVVY